MKTFAHFNAKTVDEAVSLLRRYGGKASVVAGGTDLLGKMKDRILPAYPEALVNLKTIPGLDFIREEGNMLKVGALTRLEDIAHDGVVKGGYTALAQAAHRTASPHLREMGTIGGNLCQDIRCWYYRNPNNRFPCLRKGGGRCYALEGDTRYHSIFGGSVEEGCIAVHPSDMAPALIALNGEVRTSKRTIGAEDFFQVGVSKTTVLEGDEVVTEIQVPRPAAGTKSAFLKFALRKSIDFPIVNCAVMVNGSKGKVDGARICLNAVYVKPYRVRKAEEAIVGKALNEANAEAACEAAVAGAAPRPDNAYMVQVAKIMVKRALLDCK
jgi:xanthine dehydrogenase YagS FAD-binding subunit